MAVGSSIGVIFMSDRETQIAPKIPGVAGPGVAAVLGALIAIFGRRAYSEESRNLMLTGGSLSVELGFLLRMRLRRTRRWGE